MHYSFTLNNHKIHPKETNAEVQSEQYDIILCADCLFFDEGKYHVLILFIYYLLMF